MNLVNIIWDLGSGNDTTPVNIEGYRVVGIHVPGDFDAPGAVFKIAYGDNDTLRFVGLNDLGTPGGLFGYAPSAVPETHYFSTDHVLVGTRISLAPMGFGSTSDCKITLILEPIK